MEVPLVVRYVCGPDGLGGACGTSITDPKVQDMFVRRKEEVRIGGFAKVPTHDELARRLAIIHERATIWDPGVEGMAIELCGD
eukprot:7236294-Pyramimonas_sp.AAC.1